MRFFGQPYVVFEILRQIDINRQKKSAKRSEADMTNATLSERILESMIERKEAQGLTNAIIAEMTGVPESTVTKLFNGTIKSPTLETVLPVLHALNLTIEGILESEGSGEPGNEKGGHDDEKYIKMLVVNYEKRIKTQTRWIIVLSTILITVFVILSGIQFYDITHPSAGWVQF